MSSLVLTCAIRFDVTHITGQRREVCLEAWRVCRELARRLQSGNGGAGLIFDYGDITVTKDTLRAFRDHKETHIFDGPGTADLTADVNFGDLYRAFRMHAAKDGKDALNSLKVVAPMTQQGFLRGMGIDARAEVLCKTADFKKSNQIKKEVLMLTAEDQMGYRFKAMAVVGQPKTEPPRAITLFE